jgi:succinate dehydrogenase / fumarate reductase, iron-sulfur subunit
MVGQMDEEGFGACTVTGSCEAVCPKGISLNFIARMNRDYCVRQYPSEPQRPRVSASS